MSNYQIFTFNALVCLILLHITTFAYSDFDTSTQNELYSQSYGKAQNEYFLVYLHGGPGYNSASFELSSAKRLGEKVFTVAYDRSSTGRSATGKANHFTFKHAVKDIDNILLKYGFIPDKHKLILLGHSFGGTLALRYLDENPDIVNKVILVNTAISYQKALTNILNRCRAVYKATNDQINIEYLNKIEKMNSDSKEYLGYLQAHSLLCGLHNPPVKTTENHAIIAKIKASPLKKWLSDSQQKPFLGFYMKERYSLIDDKDIILTYKDKIAYLHGTQDFTLDKTGSNYLIDILENDYLPIEGAGHNLFFDQESRFISAVFSIIGI